MPARVDALEQSGPLLTDDERRLLELLSDGFRTAEIAAGCDLSVRAVRDRVSRLMAKLDARTRPHAAAIGFRRQILTVERRADSGLVDWL